MHSLLSIASFSKKYRRKNNSPRPAVIAAIFFRNKLRSRYEIIMQQANRSFLNIDKATSVEKLDRKKYHLINILKIFIRDE